jgi:ATP-dependent Clp protease ATP-binding subunit ClpA
VRTEVRRQLDPNRRSKDIENFDHYLRQKIVGQDAAIDAVVDIFQMFTAGLSPRNRPVGNLLFLGPTGTGKTRVVEALAEVLFGSDRSLIKIDCAEFQHSQEISKLIGSPPGYLGHRETHPVLNQEAIDQYHTDKFKLSIILFDEIEKASDAIWQLLLGILDKGCLTLGDNHRVDLSSCIIIMTSNLGATEMSSLANGGLGFRIVADTPQSTVAVDDDCDKKITRTAQEAARRKFAPEFMNRIDKTVVFKTLRSEHLRRILDLELVAVQQRVLLSSGTQFLFNCEDEVKELLLSEGTDPKYGARHLKRVIERYLVFPLANLVATHQIKTGDGIKVTLDKDAELVFTVETEGSATPTLLANGAAII